MPYNIENIFICLAAPFLIAALGTNAGNRKNYLFIVLGFVCCVISAYLNTFFSGSLKGGENNCRIGNLTGYRGNRKAAASFVRLDCF